MQSSTRIPFLSTEGVLGLAVTIYLGLAVMTWDQRALGVVIASLLFLDFTRRLNRGFLIKSAVFLAGMGILLSGTWRLIWEGFHESFPNVTKEAVIFRIIIVVSIATCCAAAYTFLIRPWGREGYRVLPAQVIAFGASMIGIGFLTLLVGLLWQFRQDLAAGTKPSGAPVFTLGPPQITQSEPVPALPPPQRAEPTPFFTRYNLTDAGITALTDELYKSRDALGRTIELNRMSTDGSAGGFISNFGRACDQAGIECPVASVHPNSPDEKGIMIYVADPNKPPAAATELKAILLKLGIDVPFVPRPGFGPERYTVFVGPAP
jgi:hypothetical protein